MKSLQLLSFKVVNGKKDPTKLWGILKLADYENGVIYKDVLVDLSAQCLIRDLEPNLDDLGL